ncbi:MAG: 16S rRNA (cytosine(1402)-N(4))-methyltransferase RsmH [Peptococcaceae bacterium]|nr:16S rRNA (cytosine(1402)-N(4))-methyltransferase RsmH [Peptococcaceae bacterium]
MDRGTEGEYRYEHRPVLVREVLDCLKPDDKGIYVDCTLGGAGHSYEILRASSPGGRVIGLDRDADAIKAAARRLAEFGDRAVLVRGNFRDLPGILDRLGVIQVDGILFDLGVSSYQLDNPHRGFSYQKDAPLDMRMDREGGVTAADLVNKLPAEDLRQIIRQYGEEQFAGRIASFIVREREKDPITTTGRLADIVKRAIPAKNRREGPHPARRTFQALRIAVNRELEALGDALRGTVDRLKPGGRVCVIAYHSLEDRMVKDFFREMTLKCVCPRDFPACVCGKSPLLKVVKPGGITPSAAEIEENPRARSARLRAAERLP